MKKYYQYLGLILIMVFGFYYTEKVALIVLNKNPLMQEINAKANNYKEDFVNAIIEDNYIIPGINGKVVDSKESFYNMQDMNVFNSLYLVFKQVKPDVSLEDNKDKIINQGNNYLNKISLILENNNNLSNYLKSKNIKANILTNLNNYKRNNYFEVINNELENFKELDNTLSLNKENKHLCMINSNNIDLCKKYKYYLIEPTYILNNNIIEIKNKIDKGNIILIKDNTKLEDLLILLKEIKYKDLDIVYLSELISEENN